jgi:hypothetical protein
MTQLSLTDWTPPVPAPTASEQSVQLARCEGAQAVAILAWLRNRAMGYQDFHLHELERAIPGTPGSAGRVMRSLRAKGLHDAKNIDRGASLYRVSWVKA